MKTIIHAALIGLFVTCLSGADWPQFRGPGGSSLAVDTRLPVAWDDQDDVNIVWRIDLPGRGKCTSMVVRNPGSGALQELFQVI